jgi:hypothetical protein
MRLVKYDIIFSFLCTLNIGQKMIWKFFFGNFPLEIFLQIEVSFEWKQLAGMQQNFGLGKQKIIC